MQTPTLILPAGPQPRSLPTPSPAARPGTLHAGSRGIWKDTRTKPLAA
ncbi:hypothetical protein HNQ07_003787 [Deinococcus metalli]|uniref:Uncharacterized protein n=1 Tax=Deinococcus metalli TaxID=1141878 RepID=A0A7W8KJU8_9DEIO|nr:hypothetical protein [Deinococcus metalli]MBB5378286.1 hypothetical protein [Deinococcus metalli]GHF57429.1 hypothetical protein GCM10017781_37250 [Deinococcus metalli]